MSQSVELVRALLRRRLKKNKSFHKWMKKVDKDENGSISSNEWGKLLIKLKKRDDESDGWELTSQVALQSFKTALSAHFKNCTSNNELT
jgi:hypothetical protein